MEPWIEVPEQSGGIEAAQNDEKTEQAAKEGGRETIEIKTTLKINIKMIHTAETLAKIEAECKEKALF